MRLEAGSPEFKLLCEQGKTVHVFLDGVEVSHCRVADEEAGVVECCVLDADGGVQVDPSARDKVWVEEKHGAVRIEVRG